MKFLSKELCTIVYHNLEYGPKLKKHACHSNRLSVRNKSAVDYMYVEGVDFILSEPEYFGLCSDSVSRRRTSPSPLTQTA